MLDERGAAAEEGAVALPFPLASALLAAGGGGREAAAAFLTDSCRGDGFFIALLSGFAGCAGGAAFLVGGGVGVGLAFLAGGAGASASVFVLLALFLKTSAGLDAEAASCWRFLDRDGAMLCDG